MGPILDTSGVAHLGPMWGRATKPIYAPIGLANLGPTSAPHKSPQRAYVGPIYASLSPMSGQHVTHVGPMWDPSCTYLGWPIWDQCGAARQNPYMPQLGWPIWVPHQLHTKAHKEPMWVPCSTHLGPIWAGLSPTSGQHVVHMGPMWDPSFYTSGLAHLGPMWGRATKPMWDLLGQPTSGPCGS